MDHRAKAGPALCAERNLQRGQTATCPRRPTQGSYIEPNSHAIARPAANAANESSVITGTGGYGVGSRPISILALGRRLSAAGRTMDVSSHGLGAHRHHAVFQVVAHQPPVHRIGEDRADKQRHRHDEPEHRRGWTTAAEVHLQQHHGRDHAGHQQVHRQKLGYERAGQRARVGAADHVAHEQRLENHPAEGKAQNVFEDHLPPPAEMQHACERRAHKNADAVTGDTVHGRAQRLPPARRGILLVQPR